MKNRYFPLIFLLILLFLFSTAATCNLCGITPTTETTASDTTENEADEASDKTTETKETVAEATEKETTETTESKTTDSPKEAPTINLEIYEGPTYIQGDKQTADDDICYYRVEAIVTGDPAPTIKFSKDDSNGAFGSKKTQVNLTYSNQSYTLTATATNSAGQATDSITFDWGCGPPKVEKTVLFRAIDIGTIGPNGYQGLQMLSFGDSQYNTDWRGRFAFDVNSLLGDEIIYAKVSLADPQLSPNPCNFKGNIVIFYNDYLPDITSSDYNIAAYAGPEVFAWDADPLQFSNDFLKNKIKERADSGVKLQFGIGYYNLNTGGLKDIFEGRSYYNTNIILTVTYYELANA